MSCVIKPIHFAASKFTVIDEFEGEKGFFLRGFLINNKMNANGWMVTNQANINDGKDFVGKPDIEFLLDGKRDHTVGDTLQESLKLQEPFRKGTIIKVIDVDGKGTKLEAISKITDPKTIKNIKIGDVMYYSPAIFPRSMADVEIISTGDNSHMHIIHGYHALHRALVDDPAFGKGDAKISQTCEGSPDSCSVKLAQKNAGIGDDEINPLRQVKLIDVKKCSKTGAFTFELEKSEFSSKVTEILSKIKSPTDKDLVDAFSKARVDVNNSHIPTQNTNNKNLATEEEREKKIAKLTADVDELMKEKSEAKKAAEEKEKEDAKKGNEDTEKKDSKKGNEDEKKKDAKKGNEDETKKNLTAEEEKKKEEEMSARITSEVAKKIPLIEKFVAAKTLVASLDEKAQTELREKMFKSSLEDVQRDWDNIEPFAASLQFEKEQTTQSKYNYGGYAASTDLDNKSTEELLAEMSA